MSRARLIPTLALLAGVLLAPSASALDIGTRVNGIGMVDYSGKPTFHVGSWVRYRVTANSEMGMSDDYTVTLLIAGEENFWGDHGFWIETWTDIPGHATTTTAALMSYSIFADTLALPHLQVYMRKTLGGIREDGTVEENLYERAEESLRSRTPVGGQVTWDWVPLGRDTAVTPKGTFDCEKRRMEQGTGQTAQGGDSTLLTEVRENRTMYFTPIVPITHLAKEEIEYFMTRRTWQIGRSKDSGAANTVDRSLGTARLLDFGSEGLVPRLVPEDRRHALGSTPQARPAAQGAKPVPKRATAKKSG
jgi:hypothetical protein